MKSSIFLSSRLIPNAGPEQELDYLYLDYQETDNGVDPIYGKQNVFIFNSHYPFFIVILRNR